MNVLSLRTAVISAIGTTAFYLMGVPLPFFFGPMFFCLAAALIGAELKGFGVIGVIGRTILGVAVGASITPALFADIVNLASSLVYVPLYLILAGLIGIPWFYYIWRLNFATSYYSAMPGGLIDMVIFGEEAGGDMRALSLIHATRVLVVVTLIPLVMTQYYQLSLDQPMGETVAAIPLIELALMAFASIAGWKIAARFNMLGASLLGPMFLAAVFSLTGLIHFRPPAVAIEFAQFVLGTGIGVHFAGISVRELRNFVLAGISYTVILFIVTILFITYLPPSKLNESVNLLLAFAPGGQAEMAVLALVAGADLGFVISHHLTRMFLVIIGAPLCISIARRFANRPK